MSPCLTHKYILLAILSLSMVGCGDDDAAVDASSDATLDATSDATSDAVLTGDVTLDAAEDVSPTNGVSGIYDVETVTCGGEVQSVMVTAKVTFDQDSYLEEWTLENSDCEVTLEGTVVSSDSQITITDVEVTCAAACEPLGFCDPTHCTSDQTYQTTRTGDELLLSFTQQGDQFSCGPCGDGIAGSYLLKELP